LLHSLGIPFVTLLDLDLGRYQGGWGRIKYAISQLLEFPTIESNLSKAHLTGLAKWDGPEQLLKSENGKDWFKFLESAGVFFSYPMDLDFALLQKFPDAYGIEEDDLEEPDEDIVVAVLGKNHGDVSQYTDSRRSSFGAYHSCFKLRSKPAAHLAAMAELDDADINANMPRSIGRLLDQVKQKLDELPE
jgi:putative ATP-dependent endonuclease of the OLD family